MGYMGGAIILGLWGGPGGKPWATPISGISEITIKLDDGNNIKSISFTDTNGDTSETFGGSDSVEEKKIPILWPSEYLTSIGGTYGESAGETVITSLTFTTNANTYGPIGGTKGDAFSIPIEDSVVVGFHGRSSDRLDAIGILVQPDGRVSLGPWGGMGGGNRPFSFKVANWIKEITIYYGQYCIIGIALKDANGNQYQKIGDEPEQRYQQKINIAGPSEYVTSISGTYGKHKYADPVVTSLSIKTNLTTHGPFGASNGVSFSVPIKDSVVVGFHGRSGGYIDAIGIFVKPTLTI